VLTITRLTGAIQAGEGAMSEQDTINRVDQMKQANVFLFPLERTRAWRAVEIACLRSAGGGSISVHRIRAYLRREFSNVPSQLLAPELERVADYLKARVQGHRARCGLARQSSPRSAEVVTLSDPPPAA